MQITSFVHIFFFLFGFARLAQAGDDEPLNSDSPHSPPQDRTLNTIHHELTEPSLHFYAVPSPHPALAGLRKQEAARKSPVVLLRPSSSGGAPSDRFEFGAREKKLQRIEASRSPRGRPAVYPPPSIRVPSSNPTAAEGPLTDVFKHYVNPGHFYRHGLRYGAIPSSELPLPVSSTGEEFAKVLLPQDTRWTFPQPRNREEAYRIALGQTHNPDEKARKAREVLGMYEREADQIRQVIESRGELPLYTSEEWKEWVKEHGPGLLIAPWQQGRFREAVGSEAFEAQKKVAQALRGEGEVIRLTGREEKVAANILVSLWTAAHERILGDVRP